MACHPLSPLFSLPAPVPRAAPDWEPALTQLRTLPRAQLVRLVTAWLQRNGFARTTPLPNGPAALTVAAECESLPVPVKAVVRIYQRRSRLHAHHVEAFFGYLVRTGTPAGILITTGEFTREAELLAADWTAPAVRLYPGTIWSAELASGRVGLRRRSLWRWVVDLGRTGVHRLAETKDCLPTVRLGCRLVPGGAQ